MKNVIIIIIGIIILGLLIQNTNYISIKFLFWHIGMPKIILILVVFIIGFIFGYISAGKKYFKHFKYKK